MYIIYWMARISNTHIIKYFQEMFNDPSKNKTCNLGVRREEKGKEKIRDGHAAFGGIV